MKIALVVNSRAGAGKAVKLSSQISALLTERKIGYNLIEGSSAEDSINILRDLHFRTPFTTIISVGGDGLAHALFNVAVDLQLPLLVAPGGTGNDFARQVGTFGKDAAALINLLTDSSPSLIDLGRISTHGRELVFGQVLSTGFDSLVNERANGFKFVRGRLKYIFATLLELPTFVPRTYSLKVDGMTFETGAMLVAVANGRSYGGGMLVSPFSDNQDGFLDVMILKPVPLRTFLKVFPKVFRGGHVNHPAVAFLRAKQIHINAHAVAYADGERVGELPIEISVAHNALRTWIA